MGRRGARGNPSSLDQEGEGLDPVAPRRHRRRRRPPAERRRLPARVGRPGSRGRRPHGLRPARLRPAWSAHARAVARVVGRVDGVCARVRGGAVGRLGGEAGSEYLAGYLLERSLSLDNIFVFAVILGYFAVPGGGAAAGARRGASCSRSSCAWSSSSLGAALLTAFHVTFYVFGVLLLYTAWKLARHDDTEIEPEHNPALQLHPQARADDRATTTATSSSRARTASASPRRCSPCSSSSRRPTSSSPSTRSRRSSPSPQEPFIVFAANAFAMLGLRALYFLLVGLMDRFVYLSQGLAVILALHRREDAAHRRLARADLALAGGDRRRAGAHRAAVDARGAPARRADGGIGADRAPEPPPRRPTAAPPPPSAPRDPGRDRACAAQARGSGAWA